MIIRKLELHNFGIYADTNIFKFDGSAPIVLIGGMNGRGKTTFLEAVLLVLYGSNSFAYSESYYTSYGQYLKSFVNTADNTLFTYVEIDFVLEGNSEETYRVKREWHGDKKRVTEKIKVFKNNVFNQFLTDNWAMFMENILPSALSSFFFFDGEKIAELAVEKTSKQMKESIKLLLGISVLDLLKSDLKRIVGRTAKNQINSSETEEIEKLRMEKDEAIQRLEDLDIEIDELVDRKIGAEQKLEKKEQEYIAKGGDIVTQRQALFQKKAVLAEKIHAGKERLVQDAASDLPLILVKDLLESVRQNAEIEHEEKMLKIALDKMKGLYADFEKSIEDTSTVKQFMNFVGNQTVEKSPVVSFGFSDSELLKLQDLLDTKLNQTQGDIINKQIELRKVEKEIEQLDNYLAIDIDEKVIARIYKRIKEIEQEIIEIDVQIAHKTSIRQTYNGEVISSTSNFNKRVEHFLKKVEINDDSDRIIQYSHMAETILEEYKLELQKAKIDVVAKTMTDCYKRLASKKNLIDKISMDPVTLDLRYLNSDGIEVEKSSLSAGEKQLMVIALLWALALCSKKKLPVIIDTPLSRLDSAHRAALCKIYFPNASEQTIILSTDSEIDELHYSIMKDNIGDEFILEYDEDTKATTIRKGYFLEDTR
ncbi:DNA sulfur modification protein DndD [Ohessyouella blattaphilus]|uniref:Nuclease SbcCD subunit C n=1 Tax=Ohessyouella blattaphilus TaxID=2949333 RepID=A0ABT1EJK6_9FIRM|nr:DNA sulfur modification protein DndD [Ohessyouella blattaphilus]MCP1110891.1 DNA sulfur modification protein DndD [Ohessyouella blattaphilus]MCR8564285.1 DNA sulfur modification protein DndD [Ohessyouella blattaphilus]